MMADDPPLNDNAAALEDLHREVLRGNFTGRIVLHCRDGRIEDVEITTRRVPPHKRNGVARG